MNAARPGGRKADAEAASVLGVAAGRESRRLLMAHLDELQSLLIRSQGLEDAVDAVAWKPEDGIDAPFDQALDQQIRNCLRHVSLLNMLCGTSIQACII